MVRFSRRSLVTAGAFTPLIGSFTAHGAPLAGQGGRESAGGDDVWSWIVSQYDVRPDLINVENGNWGLMARPVLEAYLAHTERVNRDNSFFARREFGAMAREIIALVQARLNAGDNEVALTRGATEALQCIIGGYNGLQPGDAVMMADLDYGSIMEAMRFRAARSGAEVVTLNIPEGAGFEALIEFYRQAFLAHPQTKLLLLTHISHRTGLMPPVREITEIAHQHGIDVVVDAAHSWGQVEFTVDDLGADFVGFNLHKWIGAPIGVGAMYIRADKLSRIDQNLSEVSGDRERIQTRVHTGTSNFAAVMTVPDAFAFQDVLRRADKAGRLSALRRIWVDAVRDVAGIEVLTPDDDRLHAGMTSFRFSGMTDAQSNRAIAEYLLERHNVFTVLRTGVASGACVRVTPGYYNTPEEMQIVSRAILDAHRHFTA
ncbi:penicillin epimerase [Leptolyngbya valderiana BDU 20041]|nr:penicillin epimerase [Leptolyngbya valderiana BDU 20041]